MIFFCCQAFAQPVEYKGLRIEITNLQILKKKTKKAKLRLDLVNTGTRTVILHPLQSDPGLIFLFDQPLGNQRLQDLDAEIISSLRQKKITLKPGELMRDVQITINPSKRGVPVKSIEGSVSVKTSKPTAAECADLVIDTIYVVKQNDKTAEIEFVLRNKGSTFVDLSKVDAQKAHNLSVKVHFSTLDHLTKGSEDREGFFVEIPRKSNGILQPGQTMTFAQKIDVLGNTRMSPFIILSIDPLLEVQECLDNNNEGSVQLRY
jgi:hypothetical protein